MPKYKPTKQDLYETTPCPICGNYTLDEESKTCGNWQCDEALKMFEEDLERDLWDWLSHEDLS